MSRVSSGDDLFHDEWLATAPELRGAWSRVQARFRLPKLRVIERGIRRFLAEHPERTPIVLHEHGCGSGFNLATLKQLLGDAAADILFSGTDIAPRAVEFARSKYPDIRFSVDDAQASALPERAFDVMVSADLLGHLPNLEAAVSHVARCLRPGGWYVTFTETDGYRRDPGSWREPICRLAGVDPWIEKDLHVNLKSAAAIQDVFRHAGFRTIDGHPNLDGGALVARVGGKDVRTMVGLTQLSPDAYLERCMRAETRVEKLGLKSSVTRAHFVMKFLTGDRGRHDRGGYYFIFERQR